LFASNSAKTFSEKIAAGFRVTKLEVREAQRKSAGDAGPSAKRRAMMNDSGSGKKPGRRVSQVMTVQRSIARSNAWITTVSPAQASFLERPPQVEWWR